MFRELHAMGTISGMAFEDARVKARKVRLSCGYDLATSHPSEKDENGEDAMDHLEEDAQYDSIYPQSEDGEDVEGRDVDVVDGEGGNVTEGQADEDVVGRDSDGQ